MATAAIFRSSPSIKSQALRLCCYFHPRRKQGRLCPLMTTLIAYLTFLKEATFRTLGGGAVIVLPELDQKCSVINNNTLFATSAEKKWQRKRQTGTEWEIKLLKWSQTSKYNWSKVTINCGCKRTAPNTILALEDFTMSSFFIVGWREKYPLHFPLYLAHQPLLS